MPQDSFEDIMNSLHSNKGFTFSLASHKLNPNFGFSVAVDKENEVVLPSVVRYKKDFLEYKIKEYIDSHLSSLNDESRYVGGWIEGGKLYLDVVEIVLNVELATALAKKRSQEAFFDNYKKQTIYVN